MKIVPQDTHLRTKEFVDLYPIHRNTLYKWLNAGVIKGSFIHGLWFIPSSELERLRLQEKK